MEIIKDLIPINEFSRSGKKLKSVKKIAIHYYGNHGTTAQQNRDYIAGLKNQDPYDDIKDTYASAHVFIDSKEIITAIPLDEIAYHVGGSYTPYGLKISSWPNCRVLGVEMYHPTKNGKPDIMTLANTVVFCAEQCIEHNLNAITDICRHYDITGKICPKFYVDNPEEFLRFKILVKEEIERRLL